MPDKPPLLPTEPDVVVSTLEPGGRRGSGWVVSSLPGTGQDSRLGCWGEQS